MNATVFIATSLDGFIAREDGGIDWLTSSEGAGDEGDYGYTEFFEGVDALVMGRNTFEVARTFGAWPYGDKLVVVLTSRELEIPQELSGHVERMSGSPADIVRELAAKGIERIYIDGGKVVQTFLAEGLIDRLIITRIPVLLGRGIPLFGPIHRDIRLHHVATQSYPSGLVQSEYLVPIHP